MESCDLLSTDCSLVPAVIYNHNNMHHHAKTYTVRDNHQLNSTSTCQELRSWSSGTLFHPLRKNKQLSTARVLVLLPRACYSDQSHNTIVSLELLIQCCCPFRNPLQLRLQSALSAWRLMHGRLAACSQSCYAVGTLSVEAASDCSQTNAVLAVGSSSLAMP